MLSRDSRGSSVGREAESIASTASNFARGRVIVAVRGELSGSAMHARPPS